MAVLTPSLSSHLLRPPPLLSLLLVTPLALSFTRRHAPPHLLRLSDTSLSSKPLPSLLPIRSLSTSRLPPQPDTHENTETEGEEDSVFVKLPNPASFIDGDETDSYSVRRSEAEIEEERVYNNNNNNDNDYSNNDDDVKIAKRDKGWVKLPSLSVKEKKEMGSYAHSLGKKLKSQQVGKGGVTEAVGVALVESLEKNELLKIKIHNNCPGEIDDNVKRLEELTGSVVVGQIGRTVILYRPSMTKLKAEEKKKHAQAVVSRRRQAFKSSSENRGLQPKENGRGRRGSSRYSTPS